MSEKDFLQESQNELETNIDQNYMSDIVLQSEKINWENIKMEFLNEWLERKVILKYEQNKNWEKTNWEFEISKKWKNEYIIKTKKWVDYTLLWYALDWKIIGSSFDATNKSEFNKFLWSFFSDEKVLWKDREKFPQTWMKTYDFLNPDTSKLSGGLRINNLDNNIPVKEWFVQKNTSPDKQWFFDFSYQVQSGDSLRKIQKEFEKKFNTEYSFHNIVDSNWKTPNATNLKIWQELKIRAKLYTKNNDKNRNLESELERSERSKWVEIAEQNWVYFYKPQKWDTVAKVLEKLKKYEQSMWVSDADFSYLQEPEYKIFSKSRNIKSINIPPQNDLSKIPFVIIPMKKEERIISKEKLQESANDALDNLENWIYAKQFKNLMDKVPISDKDEVKKHFVQTMLAFAATESWMWTATFHRRENSYKAYSVSMFHILLEKNWDWISDWPGLTALTKLGYNIWDVNTDPTKACEFFMWYRFEKANFIKKVEKKELREVIPLTDKNKETAWRIFNWDRTWAYPKVLNANYSIYCSGELLQLKDKDKSGKYKVFVYTIPKEKEWLEIWEAIEEFDFRRGTIVTNVSWKVDNNERKVKSQEQIYIKIPLEYESTLDAVLDFLDF